MSMVRVHHFAISLDGYGTGEGQGPEAPFGHAGTSLMEWFFSTRLGRGVHGDSGGGAHPPSTAGHRVRQRHLLPLRRCRADRGAADRTGLAAERGGGPDIRIGGGPTTTRAFLEVDLVDHLHLAVVPVVLGRGERLWSSGLEGMQERFEHVETVSSPSGVVHVTFTREPRR